MTRDYNGMRGPVPFYSRAYDWREARRLDASIVGLREKLTRPRRPSTGLGPFARGTFRVKL
jgi:hypothetical protein